MALLHVAGLLGTGWDMIKDIFKEDLKRRMKKRKISKVRYIAIDEFAVRKGHKYISIIMDLESGMVLNAALGRDGNAILPFLYRLKRAQAPLQAVAVDMSPAFLKAVKTVFPNLDVVHDPYHVMALASRAVDTVRRDLARGLNEEGKKVIKGSRFLLLRGLESLSASHLEKLTILMESNRPLYLAYLLKEDLRRLWDHGNSRLALRFIVQWLERAVESGLKPFVKLALTIIRHLDQLLSYFSHRISTGPLEGLNNKIKTLKRQAYGYRDMEFFFLRILFIHESIYSITG
jgi:transposase